MKKTEIKSKLTELNKQYKFLTDLHNDETYLKLRNKMQKQALVIVESRSAELEKVKKEISYYQNELKCVTQ